MDKKELVESQIKELKDYFSFVIVKDDDVAIATNAISNVRKIIKTIDNELFAEQIQSAKKTLALVKDAKNKLLEIPYKIESHLLSQIKQYREKQRQELLQKQLEEEKKKAEEEKQALELFGLQEITEKEIEQKEEVIKKEVEQKVIDKQKVDGVITAKRWAVELIDLPALLKAILDGNAPAELITFNQSYADALARQHKDQLNIAGLRVYQKEEIRIK